MSKLCFDNEPPNITLRFNCSSSCCKSQLEKRGDVPDCAIESPELSSSPETNTLCCCFVRKRHAKSVKSNELLEDGKEIESDLL